ncbi:uncharacterized protein LOC130983177 [Arachis stenosperma]|uniref:uncharacterized protein LOC130983177 n=1 Tax=Arachis stenosperma TaxID=217475 RepID=UPI0025AD69ED|nr:uncharacterized protein LOC130983177 [Arachis stenosperma]
MVQLIVVAMLTLSSCKENKVAIASSGSALCEAASVGGAIWILVETIEDGSSLGKEHAVSIDGTRRTKNMARELLLLLRDYSNYSSRQKQMNRELIERIVEEIDVDGEKLADAKLRLVEEMIAKLNT